MNNDRFSPSKKAVRFIQQQYNTRQQIQKINNNNNKFNSNFNQFQRNNTLNVNKSTNNSNIYSNNLSYIPNTSTNLNSYNTFMQNTPSSKQNNYLNRFNNSTYNSNTNINSNKIPQSTNTNININNITANVTYDVFYDDILHKYKSENEKIKPRKNSNIPTNTTKKRMSKIPNFKRKSHLYDIQNFGNNLSSNTKEILSNLKRLKTQGDTTVNNSNVNNVRANRMPINNNSEALKFLNANTTNINKNQHIRKVKLLKYPDNINNNHNNTLNINDNTNTKIGTNLNHLNHTVLNLTGAKRDELPSINNKPILIESPKKQSIHNHDTVSKKEGKFHYNHNHNHNHNNHVHKSKKRGTKAFLDKINVKKGILESLGIKNLESSDTSKLLNINNKVELNYNNNKEENNNNNEKDQDEINKSKISKQSKLFAQILSKKKMKFEGNIPQYSTNILNNADYGRKDNRMKTKKKINKRGLIDLYSFDESEKGIKENVNNVLSVLDHRNDDDENESSLIKETKSIKSKSKKRTILGCIPICI